MKFRAIVAAICVGTLASVAGAYDGEDDATNYISSWEFMSGGTGFGRWKIISGSTGSYSTPVASAGVYGGNAAAMDTGGKCLVLETTDLQLSSFSVSRDFTTARQDGMKVQFKMQAGTDGYTSVLFNRDSGRFGRVQSGQDLHYHIAHGGGFTDTGISSNVPIAVTGTFNGSVGKWDLQINNLLTNEVVKYTGLDAEFGSGQAGGLFFSVSGPQTGTSYLFLNEFIVDPQGSLSKVENALQY